MKVFKFGGASVKDANGVKNVIKVLQNEDNTNILIVISAMGKTTNALEIVVTQYLDNDPALKNSINAIKEYHIEMLKALFEHKQHVVFQKVNSLISDMETTLKRNKSLQYDYVYDQIVCYGELISTTIVSEYLSSKGYVNTWLDVRDVIKTDRMYRDAEVNWGVTQQNIADKVDRKRLTITQGFIGSDANNFTTTLGREGSDYTAGIFAYCTNATSVTIWKDVPGVLNGDPRVFQQTKLLSQIS